MGAATCLPPGPTALEALSAARRDVGPHFGLRVQEAVTREWCEDCGELVLAIVLPKPSRIVLAQIGEVQPSARCPLCAHIKRRGHEPGWCFKCGGTGWTGTALPQPGVAIGPDGSARLFKGRRREGEAVHALHECVAALALAG
jgi:hypothetical protein